MSTGLSGFVAHWLQIIGFRYAPASALAPYSYLQILSATALGWAVFGQLPDAITGSGMALICAAGLVVAAMDARAGRSRTAPGAAAAGHTPPRQAATMSADSS